MTKNQLRLLISAGAFSAALLSGAAYAKETKVKVSTGTQSSEPPVSDTTTTKNVVKSSTSTPKGFFAHGCAGSGGCGGK